MNSFRPSIAFLLVVILAGCDSAPESPKTSVQREEGTEDNLPTAPVAEAGSTKTIPTRYPYFGQTHQHIGWSFDEAIYNVRLGPDNAFRHARGDKVKHPAGYEVQLKLPLDFMVVSDHSEYLGVLIRMYDPDDALSKNPLAKSIVGSGDDVDASTKAFYGLVSQTIQPDGSTKPDPTLNTPELKRTIWDQYIEIADRFNDPGTFTTLVGYEWSSQPNMSNQHRNVLFRSSEKLPVPFSYFDSQKPEDLWAWMDGHRARGIELLAIPHNGNLSNGVMFAMEDSDGNPLTRAPTAETWIASRS